MVFPNEWFSTRLDDEGMPGKDQETLPIRVGRAALFSVRYGFVAQAAREYRCCFRMLVDVIRKILCSDLPVTLPSAALQDANAL